VWTWRRLCTLSSAPIWSYGIAFTWPFLDMPPFFCSKRMRFAGLEGRTCPGFQERDIKLSGAQKVVLWIKREWLARGSRSWASISVGCSDGAHRG
jgi:hypothetical protein